MPRLKDIIQSLAFRSMLLSTLIVVAVILVKPNVHDSYSRNNRDRTSVSSEDKEQAKVFFGMSPEGWTAVFTGLLFVATGALFAVTYGLFQTALRQGKEAERLLMLERRPWIQMRLEVISPPDFNEGIQVNVVLHIKNVGLSPAGGVTGGWFYPAFGAVETKKRFDEYRRRRQPHGLHGNDPVPGRRKSTRRFFRDFSCRRDGEARPS